MRTKPTTEHLINDIERSVREALAEDIGSGDITANLIPVDRHAKATIITKDDCTVCGTEWVDEVFRQLDPNVSIQWQVNDGDQVTNGTTLCTLEGNARSLLTGERSALNFLQLLSGTATTSHRYSELVKGSKLKILDTRKTIPGLRTAQKYAVACGGCYNHRIGLFDAFLIKENHIAACGGITQAINTARLQAPGKTVEVEVETIDELKQAIAAKADIVMLDNFSDTMLKEAETLEFGETQVEWSGNVTEELLPTLAKQPLIDFVSMGVLTKNCVAVDLSMRIE